jgi:hypothetical protein
MPDNTIKLPVKVERGGLTRIERDIRPLMGSVITVPVQLGNARLAVYVCTSAFETRLATDIQDELVKVVARRVADALEGKL